MRRNASTVVVLPGPAPAEVLAAVGRSMNVALIRPQDPAADDGDGFDVTAAVRSTGPAAPTGFGLPGMRERAELLGGRLTLSSVPGRGTTVRLALPLSPSAQ